MVEVHFFSLDVDGVRLRELEGVLTWEERTRATRFQVRSKPQSVHRVPGESCASCSA